MGDDSAARAGSVPTSGGAEKTKSEAYEATRTDGTRFRNTEIHGFRGEEIVRVEVYFGWDP
jgi:hypothetical protein